MTCFGGFSLVENPELDALSQERTENDDDGQNSPQSVRDDCESAPQQYRANDQENRARTSEYDTSPVQSSKRVRMPLRESAVDQSTRRENVVPCPGKGSCRGPRGPHRRNRNCDAPPHEAQHRILASLRRARAWANNTTRIARGGCQRTLATAMSVTPRSAAGPRRSRHRSPSRQTAWPRGPARAGTRSRRGSFRRPRSTRRAW